jgi:hypothetical protein
MIAAVQRLVIAALVTISALGFAATAIAAGVSFAGAGGGAHVRPHTLFLTGDGTLDVTNVSWSSWGGRTAAGRGQAEYHGCTPTCAQARVHRATVNVRLSNVRSCSGRRYYSHVRLTLGSGRLLDAAFLRTSYRPCR